MRWHSGFFQKTILLAPTLLVYLVYIVAPIIIAVRYSGTKFTGIGKPKPVGFDNYLRLFDDPIFMLALKNTLIVLIVTLVILIPGAFCLALLTKKVNRFMSTVRAINYAPAILAPILVGLIWVFILDPKIGLINQFLELVGLSDLAQFWIGGETLTPYSLAIIQSWQSLGYIATIFIAGMTLIPQELYDAADIDGATAKDKIFRITIPMLNETFKMNFILVVTLVFKIFETVIQLTNGGPNHKSEILATYMYYATFTAGEYGYGMSIAVTSLLVTLIVGFILFCIPLVRRLVSGWRLGNG